MALGRGRCLIDRTPCQEAVWSGQIGTAVTWHVERCLVPRSPTRLCALKNVPEGGEPHDLNAMSVVLSAKRNRMVPGCSCEHVDTHIKQVVLNTGVSRQRQPRRLLNNTQNIYPEDFLRGGGLKISPRLPEWTEHRCCQYLH